MNQIDLSGRVAIITGGAAGIGLACARRFLASGATVSIWDVSQERLDQAKAELAPLGHVDTRQVDVANAAHVREAANAVAAKFGRIDALVNSAGVSGRFVAAADYPLEDWQRQLDINLSGTFYCCQAVLGPMLERGYGRIVNVSSMAGKDGNPFAVAYSSAKAGVIGMTKSLGKELAPKGILVNCVTPTIFNTPMHQRTRVNMAPEQLEALRAKIPLGRIGEPHEAASMIAWLCSEDCSYSTGAVFDLSGGRATY
ncbi:MAG: SDR family NAD(P)-dependent oxidoreductase [Pseudomonadota bacterium]